MNYKPITCDHCNAAAFTCSNCGSEIKVAAYQNLKHLGCCTKCGLIQEEFCQARVEELYSCKHPDEKLIYKDNLNKVVCSDCGGDLDPPALPYQPPLEFICPTCGNKCIGCCTRQACNND